MDAFHKAVADWFSSCANPAMDTLPAWQGSATGVDAALKGVRGLPDHLKRQVEERRALYGLLDEALARARFQRLLSPAIAELVVSGKVEALGSVHELRERTGLPLHDERLIQNDFSFGLFRPPIA